MIFRAIPLQRIFHSIVTRLMLFGIVIVLGSAAVRYHMMSQFLREDLEKVVASQLAALADYVARDVDYKIAERQRMLKVLAATFPVDLLSRPAELRSWLAVRHQLQPFFSHGIFVNDEQSVAIADYPPVTERPGTNYADRDYVGAALEGIPIIGRPVIGRAVGVPVLPIGEPIRDAAGRVRGVIVGVTALAAPGFLDLLQKQRIGAGGGFLLVSPRDNIFVAASKPELIFKAVAPPGVNRLHDQAMAGWRGTGVTVNAQGVEEVVGVATVPSADWFLVARLPTEEAFASVRRTQNYIIGNVTPTVLVLILLVGLGLMVVLKPLFRAADQADRMTLGELPLVPLPVVRPDEVGHLTGAFNRLLNKLLASQAELARIAHHDGLTGLPNRLLLADRMTQALARAQRNHSRLALLFLDLDGFKAINDQLGHEAGDAALVEVTRRLVTIVREADTLARVGGDEFVLLMTDLAPEPGPAEAAACAVAAKLVEAIGATMPIKGEPRTLGVSIGIAVGDGASSGDLLLNRADAAMYRAKMSGAGCYRVADSEVQ